MDVIARKRLSLLRPAFGSNMSSVIAYDDKTQLFWAHPNKKTTGLAASWLVVPLGGVDDALQTTWEGILRMDAPADMVLQISLINSNHIEPLIAAYLDRRLEPLSDFAQNPLSNAQRKILREFSANRAEYLRAGAKKPLIGSNEAVLRNMGIVISIRKDFKGRPSQSQQDKFANMAARIGTALDNLGMHPQRLDARSYLHIMRGLLQMGTEPESYYDDTMPLNEQLLTRSDEVEVTRDHLRINDTWVTSLSVKTFPKEISLVRMHEILGDARGGDTQIGEPFVLTLSVVFPEPAGAKSKFMRNYVMTMNSAQAPLISRLDQRLSVKAENFEMFNRMLGEGERIVKVWMNICTFSTSEATAARMVTRVPTATKHLNFEFVHDRYETGDFFSEVWPMGGHAHLVRAMSVHRTMGIKHATNLSPIIGEFVGNSPDHPMSMYVSRRGQVQGMDHWRTSSGSNFVVCAETGSGKSFFVQHKLLDNLACATRCIVLDIGNSFERMCRVMGGDFVRFTNDAAYNLDPFGCIDDLVEQLDGLVNIIQTMAAPKDGFSDFERKEVGRVVQQLHERLGSELSIDHVAQVLEGETAAIAKIGTALRPFTRHGHYAQWFSGERRLSFANALTVIELKELEAKPELQAVVMLMVMSEIERLIYRTKRTGADDRIMVVVDEAWQLLRGSPGQKDNPQLRFIEGLFRKSRKHGASVGIITQSAFDVAGDPAARGIWENASFRYILKQKADSVNALEKQDVMAIGRWGYDLMRTLRTVPGSYSEALIQLDTGAYGVARLVLPRHVQLLLTTNPREVALIDQLQAKGRAPMEAIEMIVAAEARKRKAVA